MSWETYEYVYEWNTFTKSRFESAKRRARKAVASLIPNGWRYSINAQDFYSYTGNNPTKRHVIWNISFVYWAKDMPNVTLSWNPCCDSPTVEMFSYEFKGHQYPGNPVISVTIPLTFQDIGQIKKCVEVIMNAMHPGDKNEA